MGSGVPRLKGVCSFVRARARHSLALSCAITAALLSSAPAQSQSSITSATSQGALYDIDIPAQPLSQALAQLSQLTRVQVLYTQQEPFGVTAPAIKGRFSVADALNQLLAGSGLTWREVRPGAVTLEQALDAENKQTTVDERGVITLDLLRVEGETSIADEDRAYATAGSTSHISQREIERFRGTTVGDIFQGTPGVLIGENRNSGGLDVNIRGMQGQSRVPVLIDGSRQETTVWRGYAGVSSRTYVDPDLIAGIDITKGPSAAADGTGAVGGLVSMRTIGANDIIQDDQDWGVRVRAGAFGNSSSAPPANTAAGLNGTGRTYRIDCAVASLCAGEHALPESFGSAEGMNRPSSSDAGSWAGSIAAAMRFERFDLVAAYAQRSQGNYYSGTHGPTPTVELTYRELPFYTEVTAIRDGIARFRGGERVVNSNNDSNSMLLKGSIYLSDEQTWDLGYARYESDYGELMPSQLIWLDEIKQTQDSSVTAQTYTSRYQWDPASAWLDLRFNLWHTRTNTINRSFSEDIYGTFSIPPSPEHYDRSGGDLGNQMQFDAWGAHSVEYGVTAQWEDIDTEIPVGEDGAPVHNTGYGRIGDRQEYGAFVNWRWQPWPVLALEAGLRYTRAKTDDHKPVVPTGHEEYLYDDNGSVVETVYVESVFCVDRDADGECDPIRYRTDNDGTTPVVSLTYEPWSNGLQFYARYAEAIRNPSLFEATSGWSVQPALDVSLRPERARNLELGSNLLKRDALVDGDRLAAKLAIFRNRTSNYLTRTSPNTWEEQGQIFVMRNIESVNLYGSELSVEYDMGLFYGELSGTYYDHIEVCHYGSYRRERCNNYGVANSYFNNMVPPEWHASATLGMRLFAKRLDFGARGTFMGQRTETPPFNDDTARGFNRVVPWHPYNLLDIYARWKHNDTIAVDFNIDNLTDRYYLDALSLGLVPAPGRTARLSLTLTF